MERLASNLSRYLTRQGTVDEVDYDIYKYGIQTGLEMLLCIAVSSLIAVYLGLFLEYIIFAAMFFPMRAYAGGIHLQHFWACLICSCLVISAVLLFAEYFKPISFAAFIITNIILTAIYYLGEAATSEWVKDPEEIEYTARQRKKIIRIAVILNLAVWLLNCEKITSLLMYTVAVVLGSMLLEIMKNKIVYKKR